MAQVVPDPTARQLGNKFAAHFGPANKGNNASVTHVEFGNEPWDGYSAAWYREVGGFGGWGQTGRCWGKVWGMGSRGCCCEL